MDHQAHTTKYCPKRSTDNFSQENPVLNFRHKTTICYSKGEWEIASQGWSKVSETVFIFCYVLKDFPQGFVPTDLFIFFLIPS